MQITSKTASSVASHKLSGAMHGLTGNVILRLCKRRYIAPSYGAAYAKRQGTSEGTGLGMIHLCVGLKRDTGFLLGHILLPWDPMGDKPTVLTLSICEVSKLTLYSGTTSANHLSCTYRTAVKLTQALTCFKTTRPGLNSTSIFFIKLSEVWPRSGPSGILSHEILV